jgi:hypothetical protein
MYLWGFIVASKSVDPELLSEADVDARITERLSSELKSYDGITHRGYFSIPKDLRALLSAPGPLLDDATINAFGTTVAAADADSLAG